MDKCFKKLDSWLPCCKTPPRPENRTIFVSGRIPSDYETIVPEKFMSNRIVSSKYTALNFLPKNLFEQFHRIANFYFLIVAIVAVLINTPVSPWTTIAPLIFVVVVTGVKQGYEDRLRHKADREVNYRKTLVVRDGRLETIKSMEIKVGDIVKVELNSDIPCDLVMLSSDDPEGHCYITTANLDGETNLKTFSSVQETQHLQTESLLDSLTATIECQQPISDLYRFVGRINIYEANANVTTLPLGPENVLLRGARLRNTQYVYGCATYTGQETKISLNSKLAAHKYSRVEKSMNTYLVFYLILLVVYAVIWECITLGFYAQTDAQPNNMWYIGFTFDFWTENSGQQFSFVVQEFLAYMILLNYIIPISMYVTVELQKFFGSMFFEWDIEMYDELCDEPAKAVTSDLNEELGQVEYLFTDKTGTLTENEMQFRQCSVGGHVYEQVGDQLCLRSEISGAPSEPIAALTPEIERLLLVLALCHTVRVDRSPRLAPGAYSDTGREYEYQSSSPDEKALVEACSRLGTVYHGFRNNRHEISVNGKLRLYTLHQVLDFDPTRKRMSVIVQDEAGEYWLLCKGAETALFEIVAEGDIESLEQHVNDFAVLGLRTLVIASRRLTPAQFQAYDALLRNARQVLENREQKLAEAYEQVESDLTLVGATAVEDKLQDGVPETITALRQAGIQVWVLTGDKEETAVNISYSAGHFSHDMVPLSLTRQASSEECGATLDSFHQLLEESGRRGEVKKHALVVDGRSLSFALDAYHEMLRSVCERCVTVLCCRMTPIQKALVVRLMKNSDSQPTTAAIGDGANDVSMIQEAHVGLGIFGKEGRQAARSSDYAFGRFRFLKRALLVHGHYFYVRIAILVQYFFYKNVAMITAELYFTFFSAYSQQSIFTGYFLVWFNITFTALPIMLYGWFELHLPASLLEKNPTAYMTIRHNRLLSYWNFLKWNLVGLWESLVFFFGTYFALAPGNSPFENGWEYGVYDMGLVIMTACVLTVNIKLMLVSYYFNGIIVGGYVITIVGYFLMTFICCVMLWPFLPGTLIMYGSFQTMLSSSYIWLVLLFVTITALIPDILLRAVEDVFNPLHSCQRTKGMHTNVYSGSHDDLLTINSNSQPQQEPAPSSIRLSTISAAFLKYRSQLSNRSSSCADAAAANITTPTDGDDGYAYGLQNDDAAVYERVPKDGRRGAATTVTRRNVEKTRSDGNDNGVYGNPDGVYSNSVERIFSKDNDDGYYGINNKAARPAMVASRANAAGTVDSRNGIATRESWSKLVSDDEDGVVFNPRTARLVIRDHPDAAQSNRAQASARDATPGTPAHWEVFDNPMCTTEV